MELWIRSQDKNSLIKANNIYSDVLPEDGYYKIFNMPDEDILGKYLTKERALEVLDEIQRLITPTIEYNPVVKKEESWEEEYQRTVLKGYDVKIEQSITYVYEMPKE